MSIENKTSNVGLVKALSKDISLRSDGTYYRTAGDAVRDKVGRTYSPDLAGAVLTIASDGTVEPVFDKAVGRWEYIRDHVRSGAAPSLYPVGYEFTVHKTVGGSVIPIVFTVRGHDCHQAANSSLTHTMTIEAKYVYSSASGTYKGISFCAEEAMYFCAEPLPAGTYNFAWSEDSYHFTITQDIPAGGQIVLGSIPSGGVINDCVISTYASAGSTSPIEQNIALVYGAAASVTDLGTVYPSDSSVADMNCAQRMTYGSNNYAQSTVRQWLNSAAAVGEVWQPATKFSRPPSWHTSSDGYFAGFMNGLDSNFLAVVQSAVIPCRTNSLFETNSLDGTVFTVNQTYTLEDKFFLLSYPEIYGVWDSTEIKDGELLDYYDGLTNTERMKRDAGGSVRACWLRSPNPSKTYGQRIVHPEGRVGDSNAYNVISVCPSCIIA